MHATAPTLNPSDIRRIRALLSGFVFECPLGGDPEDCPCHAVRQLSASERFKWVRGLSDNQCCELFSRHIDCLKRKLASAAGLMETAPHHG